LRVVNAAVNDFAELDLESLLRRREPIDVRLALQARAAARASDLLPPVAMYASTSRRNSSSVTGRGGMGQFP
jgi:hypothetical protein